MTPKLVILDCFRHRLRESRRRECLLPKRWSHSELAYLPATVILNGAE